VQRRPAVVVFARNQRRITFEQRFDLFQVATLGCVMNLAAESKTAPSQHEQRNDGVNFISFGHKNYLIKRLQKSHVEKKVAKSICL
jgi:4-hydroxy-3-methylbut-2-en-1-yl diphosphate synthase IspG/GcpE